MVQKANAVLLIIALLFMSGCGERLTDYQIEIIEKAESIIALDDVSELSSSDVFVILGLLYTECVKLKEYKKVGSNYDKFYTAFSNLIPTYKNLQAQELENMRAKGAENDLRMTLLMINSSKAELTEYKKMLDAQEQDLKYYAAEIIADQEELFTSLLRITTERNPEKPIWAKTKAEGYLQEFYQLLEAAEKVDE